MNPGILVFEARVLKLQAKVLHADTAHKKLHPNAPAASSTPARTTVIKARLIEIRHRGEIVYGSQHGAYGDPHLRRSSRRGLKQLEDENRLLQHIVAEQTLDIQPGLLICLRKQLGPGWFRKTERRRQ
jgi:hypothetical protein